MWTRTYARCHVTSVNIVDLLTYAPPAHAQPWNLIIATRLEHRHAVSYRMGTLQVSEGI